MKRRSPYLPIGRPGEPYPAFIRELRSKPGSGSYSIKVDGELRYEGESHSGKLYQTLTRHFQTWRGPTAGPSYPRARCTVSVQLTAPSAAVETQNKRICKLDPPDNVQKPCGEVQTGTDFDPSKFAEAT